MTEVVVTLLETSPVQFVFMNIIFRAVIATCIALIDPISFYVLKRLTSLWIEAMSLWALDSKLSLILFINFAEY